MQKDMRSSDNTWHKYSFVIGDPSKFIFSIPIYNKRHRLMDCMCLERNVIEGSVFDENNIGCR
ncbi:MAG: hypothetical protein DRN05_05770 [Thermoplasmata archaeon]|nr:MAG: hypothetical protein DRN05_05770 [Thermoplasmata archaeon]